MATKTRKAAAPQIDNSEFLNTAEPLVATVAGVPIMLEPREFGTGSVGFHHGGTMTVMVGSKVIKVQANVLLTVVGSKPEKKPAAA